MSAQSPNNFPAQRPAWMMRTVAVCGPVGLTAVAAFLLLVRLGRGALMDWDEAIYAEVSREIATGHDWLTLHWQYKPFFEKPPLTFWIQAQLFQWFGVSEFWARFESAAAGIVMVLLVWAIARRMHGGVAVGYYAAFVLLTTRQFDDVARQGMTDVPLALCIFLAFYAYLRVRQGEQYWFYVVCAAVGLGGMVKGPAVLLAPLAISLDWLFQQTRAIVRAKTVGIGILQTLEIVAPWHIWMMLRYGKAFLDTYVGYQLAERATQVIEGSGGGPLYYLNVVLHGALPWSILALVAAVAWFRRKERGNGLMWITIVLTLILYSVIPTKHPWYILPVYPALAIEVGRLLADAEAKWRPARYAAVAVLLAGICIAGFKFVTRKGDPFANQVASLAKMARGSSPSGPLFIVTDSRSNSGLDVPTAIFYSHRAATYVELPADAEKLREEVTNGAHEDAILDQSAMRALPPGLQTHPLTDGNGSLVYAVISLKP